MATDHTLASLTEDVVQTFKNYDATGTKTWTYLTATHDLPYQIGSLSKLVMQLEGDRYADGRTQEEIKQLISDEIADILADTLFVAHDLGIDVGAAWEGMLASDSKKIQDRTTLSKS